MFITGIVLSIAGFLMFFNSLLVSMFTTVELPSGVVVITMVFYGLVPFVGGIALSNLTLKQWRSNVQCRMCNHRVELSSIACPNCHEKLAPMRKASGAAASDNRFNRMCRKIFLESPRQSEGEIRGNPDEVLIKSEGEGKENE